MPETTERTNWLSNISLEKWLLAIPVVVGLIAGYVELRGQTAANTTAIASFTSMGLPQQIQILTDKEASVESAEVQDRATYNQVQQSLQSQIGALTIQVTSLGQAMAGVQTSLQFLIAHWTPAMTMSSNPGPTPPPSNALTK